MERESVSHASISTRNQNLDQFSPRLELLDDPIAPGPSMACGPSPQEPLEIIACERGGQNIEGPKETAAWLEVVVPDAERQGVQEVDAVVDRPTLYGKLLHTLFLELTPCRVRSCVKWIVLSQM